MGRAVLRIKYRRACLEKGEIRISNVTEPFKFFSRDTSRVCWPVVDKHRGSATNLSGSNSLKTFRFAWSRRTLALMKPRMSTRLERNCDMMGGGSTVWKETACLVLKLERLPFDIKKSLGERSDYVIGFGSSAARRNYSNNSTTASINHKFEVGESFE